MQNTPALLLEQNLDATFGAGKTRVEVRAVGGTTLRELVAGTDHLNKPWPQSVNAYIVVINHGISDLTHDGDLAGYKANLALVARTRDVIFETPNKVQQWDLAPYAQAMRYRPAFADTYAILSLSHLSDWTHPTQAGYEFIVKTSLAPIVASKVSPLLCS